jgi:hypothetical protein
MDQRPHFKEMTKFTMSLYNNALALPMLAVVLLIQGEHNLVGDRIVAVNAAGWFWIVATCILGFMISTSGFGLQKLVSATTFLVVNNITKFLNIFLGMVFLNDKLVGLLDTAGCLLAIGAGFWYSMAQSRLLEKAKRDAKK